MLKPDLKKARVRTKDDVFVFTDKYKITSDLKKLGLNKNYFIKTYGCQMNEHDTEKIKAILEDLQFNETDNMEDADLILLNTCAIRENAHNKVFGMVGRIKHLKETKPHIIAGICGCMAQEEVVVNEILEKYRWLDIVFGTHNIHNLPNILSSSLAKKELEIEVLSIEGDIYENIPVKRESNYKAWINVMYGCDKFCTYCIVPYTRGKQRSREPEYIINEIKELVDNGYQEITLLGQNVNAYGKDLNVNYGLAELLKDVALTKIPRIRFVTSHPWDFTDEMIDVIREYDNVMPYIHLPIQSGSNEILKRMGRRYTKESYLELFHKIKKNIPNASITTDIIVGFPGETDADFQETIDVVNECQFDSAFTFIFSKRVGTPAYRMEDNVSLEVKNKRLHQLNKLVNQYSYKANQNYIGQVVPVLIESISERDESILIGFTETMKRVNVKADSSYIGKIINVEITNAKSWSLDGIIK